MISADVLRKIRRIELRTRKLVNESFAGAYRSAFKGRGIEFDSIRPYEPGDDIRLIDWNVTARTGEAFLRQYVEERELTVMLLLDTSASCLFGSTSKSKRDIAAEVAAVLAYSAINNNDKVGLILFSDRTELYVPPLKGRNHILRLIRDLLTAQPTHKETDIACALRMASRSLKRRSIIFLLSDMLVPVETYATELSLLAYHHDVMVLRFSDPLERKLPDIGLALVEDAETGQHVWIDTHAANWQRNFSAQSQQFQNRLNTTLSQANVDIVHIDVNDDYVAHLVSLFQGRLSSRH
ncbi:MAG: DUF58 domain-containing protein [Anaerolineae bacterium]|nr:DUF58 domain-containing protein [Anaerolineae bacterium]